MLPSAMGVGEGGSFRAPMAIAVIGGIIVSTVLSLVVVPSFFLIMDDLSRLLSWMFGRLVGKKEEELEAMSAEDLTRRAQENSESLSSIEQRLADIERQTRRQTGTEASDKPSNILRLPPLAAE
jgi:HAE1 family hydrophobic/amphiphilic exporter-1